LIDTPAELQSPLYPRYASYARGTSWLGSLVANKHDGSGLVYMRNRYLNPQTGQFTQTDPIGLAGGLNLYGYAGGDPVNFSDPFGLCPEHLRNASGRCPGNLKPKQYNFAQSVFSRGLTPAGSTPLLDMLKTGRIVGNKPMFNNPVAQVDHYWGGPSNIRLGPEFFSLNKADAAWVGAHEYGHVLQRETLNLIFGAPEDAMDPHAWFAITSKVGDGGEGDAYFNAQQKDADRYACSVITGGGDYATHYCK
jgi:RHS repeat-associated protein